MPLLICPICGFSDQVTLEFEVPLRVAVNVVLWLASSDTFAGDRVMLTGGG